MLRLLAHRVAAAGGGAIGVQSHGEELPAAVAWRADDSETVSYVLALALALADFNLRSPWDVRRQPRPSSRRAARALLVESGNCMAATFRVRLWLSAASDNSTYSTPGGPNIGDQNLGVDLKLQDRGGTGLGERSCVGRKRQLLRQRLPRLQRLQTTQATRSPPQRRR